jgi:hypothetical protein
VRRAASSRAQDIPELEPVYNDLNQHYEDRLQRLTRKNNGGEESSEHYARVFDLKLDLLRAERETALSLRAAGRISDETLRQIERELDLRESELTLDAEAGA